MGAGLPERSGQLGRPVQPRQRLWGRQEALYGPSNIEDCGALPPGSSQSGRWVELGQLGTAVQGDKPFCLN